MLSLEGESWTWYGLTWFIVFTRLISRRLLLGSCRKLQIEDGLMILAMATDTILIAGMNYISHTSSNLIHPGDEDALTPENISERVNGSKMVLVVEQMQCLTVWLIKCCILIMYHRLTMSLRQNFAVKIVAAYVAVSFVIMEVLYFGVWCRPFHEYWAVPSNNAQCSAATNHLITNTVFNISSDIMIIIIPLPIFLKSSLTIKKKAILCAVFAVGTFTILSAVLNKYYSFTEPWGLDWTFWYIRESSTAIIAANLPLTWTLLQRLFRMKSFREWTSYSSRDRPSRFRSTAYGRGRSLRDGNTLERGSSQERINGSPEIPLKIYQKREVEITTVAAEPGELAHRRASSSDSLPDQMTTMVHVKGGNISNINLREAASETSESSIIKAKGRS
ncbi:hypothetical protein N3K66_001249 [Trichothecium roseum]|uniref:Uncharacterized protein n=1 Tax=Trichothecium roseum TaxID=47278 RepID=A0ACC0VE69_9HYPO|nr:hypothetical protein N3K66_001249 [Trichothecium roseum]